MQSVLKPQPHYLMIHHKLKDSLSPIYLTLLSVIQGVALANLALIVAANYQQYTLMHWLLILFNFGVLIGIWNHYMMNNKLWDWIPDLRPRTGAQSHNLLEFERLAVHARLPLPNGSFGHVACALACRQGG